MISLITVHPAHIVRAPWRDSWNPFDADRPVAVEHLMNSMRLHVMNGATLPIHVANLGEKFFVLDGHFALDVYDSLQQKEITLIVHADVTSIEQARAKYVSMNYLRSTEWLRDGVKLQATLTDLGVTAAYNAMEDPDLAKDLIERNAEQWGKFSKEVLLRDHETSEHDEDQPSAF